MRPTPFSPTGGICFDLVEGFQPRTGGERGHEHHGAGFETPWRDRAHCPGVWRGRQQDSVGDRQLYEGIYQGVFTKIRRQSQENRIAAERYEAVQGF